MMAQTLEPMKELRKKERKKNSLLFLLLIIAFLPCFAQNSERVLFYNVENLFDTKDDSLKRDEEFIPGQARYWSENRLNKKINRIYQVLVAASSNQAPAIIGMCEVENTLVLNQLLEKTPLQKLGYRFIHHESPDRRGIDVALFYQKDKFIPIRYTAIPVIDIQNKYFKTRDILYVEGILGSDTLHIFVNHWPSKYGGVMETISLRLLAAKTLKNSIASVVAQNRDANILIMGDFNDAPHEESIQYLISTALEDNLKNLNLVHPALQTTFSSRGSHKYQGNWELLDQIIVSKSLCNKQGLKMKPKSFKVFEANFLLEEDEKFLGMKPNRTYIGYKYHDGFSDHLPVMIDLLLP